MEISWISKGVHKITNKLSFKGRFKYNTASRSISRIAGVFFGVFSAGLLIMLFFVGTTMVNSLINEGIKGANYNYETIYRTNIAENQLPLQQGYEPFLVLNADPIKITRQGKDVPIPSLVGNSSTTERQVFGLQANSQRLVLEDFDGNSLNYLLTNGVVITKNFAITYGLEIGDLLTFSLTSLD
ncbi:hypothetical protein AZF37_07065 [endosymbiont 'TC1' of Trimyema compressum]|nr:hypothetical protein AZF37_07065 [endosymbiont 'TC1' of Trimyema compressum]